MTLIAARFSEVGLPLAGRPSRLARSTRNVPAANPVPTAWRRSPAHLIHSLLFALIAFSTARAHDPYEAFHTAIVHPDRLELIVTMAQSTALKLLDPTAKIPALTPENLATHRPRLVREAALLFILTSARKQLTARAATIELTEENDLIFRVTYPRPAPGPLYFSAAYLRRLGDGYGGILEVNDASDQNLGWEQLLWARPNFEVTVPADSSPPKP